ncbi:sensor histidine kinase [Pleomorphovibrio marinus]|uniref:sensor histidine kinase n=1 Tax=Pleomorphovibrio marinus TaxID=2164132 RepID=UPI000E0CB5C7|nr:PAS domain-containing sensor histidine kinase [Pleomorphovibrio marinus]
MGQILKNHNHLQGDALFNMGLFFDLSPDLLCIAGFDGYFKKLNPAFIQLLGYEETELYHNPINHFVYGEDLERTIQSRVNVMKGNPLLNFENRYQTKEGEIIWLSWTSVQAEKEKLIYAIAKNITQKKKLEEERNGLITRLTKSNQELKELTYTTAHDLRAPVNNLLAIFNVIDTLKIQDPDLQEFIAMLKLSTDGLKATLDSYVDTLSQKEVLNVQVEELKLPTVFDKVKNMVTSLLINSRTIITADFTALPKIRFNGSYLESIFLNLITNSIKYAKPGQTPEIQVTSLINEGLPQLIFQDNGMGFDMERVGNRIFGFKETFHSNSDSKGIGLYLIYNHITSLGGNIEIQSQPDKGAKFIITFKG